MSRSPIQISKELKEKLEIIKVESGSSSLGEVIENMIGGIRLLEGKLNDERKQRFEENKLIKNEYIHAGENLKNQLTYLSDELRLSESRFIEFLLSNFDSERISKVAFYKYVELRK